MKLPAQSIGRGQCGPFLIFCTWRLRLAPFPIFGMRSCRLDLSLKVCTACRPQTAVRGVLLGAIFVKQLRLFLLFPDAQQHQPRVDDHGAGRDYDQEL